MKKSFVLFAVLMVVAIIPLSAQKKSLDSMSLNAATGIYVVPTAKVGFPDANFGFNIGYHTNYFEPVDSVARTNHLLQVNFSFVKMIELSGTFDIQPERYTNDHPNDLIMGFKFQLPVGSVPIAIGTSVQHIDMGKDDVKHWAFQLYGAVTYGADIFGWPAVTTLVVGHTFWEDESNNNIDFGMGFDLIIFPKALGNFLHFLIDFANFSYSTNPWGADAWARGVFNTGLRLDLSQIPALRKFTFAIDFFLADAFDSRRMTGSGRSFGAGVVFGVGF